MDLLRALLEFFLHLDTHLEALIQQYGFWTYLILFLIVFCETGLIVTPFLPGDSLLFAAGALAAIDSSGQFNVWIVALLLFVAAVLGDATNYAIGTYFGDRLITWFPRLIKREHLERTHRFYEKYGGKTIVLARFTPIVRTFAPFVAGVGRMEYRQFATYNILGAFIWVVLFVFGGYVFGNIPIVRANFEIVTVAIILISLLPIAVEWIRGRRQRPTQSA